VSFAPLPARTGRITYRRRGSGELWGQDQIRITRGSDGLRVFSAHCEMAFPGSGSGAGADEHVVRDSVLSVHEDFHPHDAFVRIMNHGRVTGTGWFRFTDSEATCESWTEAEGRISQRVPITRPIRGFGIHAVQGDGWLGATFPYEKGPGHVQYFGRNLLHSLHHFGATGPFIVTSQSGLRYVGPETVTVPAGTFDCHRIAFVGLTNNHPEYDMWLTRDGDFIYVKGEVGGYMDSVFELAELEGGPL
jgi:hypothetical protein